MSTTGWLLGVIGTEWGGGGGGGDTVVQLPSLLSQHFLSLLHPGVPSVYCRAPPVHPGQWSCERMMGIEVLSS